MKIIKKAAVSFALTLLLFTAFAIISYSTLFNIIESKFYNQKIISEKEQKIQKLLLGIDNYITEKQELADSIASEISIKNSFLINQSREDIFRRENIVSSLINRDIGFSYIRVIDEDGKIHYSSNQEDIRVSDDRKVTYKMADETSAANYMELLDVFEKQGIVFQADNNQNAFISEIYDNFGIKRGYLFLYLGENDIWEYLSSGNILEKNSVIRYPGYYSIVINMTDENSAILQDLDKYWKSSAIVNPHPLYTDDAGNSFSVISAEWKSGFAGFVLPDESFKINTVYRYILLVSAFSIFFIILFLAMNLRQDNITIIAERVKRFQINFLIEYLENKSDIEWKKWKKELENRKEEVRKEFKKGLRGIKGTEKETTVNELIDKSWDEIISLLAGHLEKKQDLKGTGQVANLQIGNIEEIIRRIITSEKDVRLKPQAQPQALTALKPAPPEAEVVADAEPEELEELDELEGEEAAAVAEAEVVADAEPEELEELDELEGEETAVLAEAEAAEDLEELDELEGEEAAAVAEAEVVADAEPEELEELDELEGEEPAAVTEAETAEDLEELDEFEGEEPAAVTEAEAAEDLEELDELEGEEPAAVAEAEAVADAEPEELEAPSVSAVDTIEKLEELEELEELEAGTEKEPGASEPGETSTTDIKTDRKIDETSKFDELVSVYKDYGEEIISVDEVQKTITEIENSLIPITDGEDEKDIEKLVNFRNIISASDKKEISDDLEPEELAETENADAEQSAELEELEELEDNRRFSDVNKSFIAGSADQGMELLDELETVEDLKPLNIDEKYEKLEALEVAENGENDEVRSVEYLKDRYKESYNKQNYMPDSFYSRIRQYRYEEMTGLAENALLEEISVHSRENIDAFSFTDKIETLQKQGLVEIENIENVFAHLYGDENAVIDKDGVLEINQELYSSSSELENRELKQLIDKVVERDEDQTAVSDVFFSENVDLPMFSDISEERPVKKNKVSNEKIDRKDGFDFDLLYKDYSGDQSVAAMRLLLKITREIDSFFGAIIVQDEASYYPETVVGLDKNLPGLLNIKKKGSLYRELLSDRKILFFKTGIREIAELKCLFSTNDIDKIKSLLFLPIRYREKQAYLVASPDKNLFTVDTLMLKVKNLQK